MRILDRRDSVLKVASEDQEQAAFVRWFRLQFPGEIIFAIPNGGHRTKSVAAKMKWTGTLPGVWDLFCPDRRLWIEMKRSDRGKLSSVQKKFGEHMLKLNYRCIVAWGCEDAINQIINGERAEWVKPKTNRR